MGFFLFLFLSAWLVFRPVLATLFSEDKVAVLLLKGVQRWAGDKSAFYVFAVTFCPLIEDMVLCEAALFFYVVIALLSFFWQLLIAVSVADVQHVKVKRAVSSGPTGCDYSLPFQNTSFFLDAHWTLQGITQMQERKEKQHIYTILVFGTILGICTCLSGDMHKHFFLYFTAYESKPFLQGWSS